MAVIVFEAFECDHPPVLDISRSVDRPKGTLSNLHDFFESVREPPLQHWIAFHLNESDVKKSHVKCYEMRAPKSRKPHSKTSDDKNYHQKVPIENEKCQ
jgi:hypothetical protein